MATTKPPHQPILPSLLHTHTHTHDQGCVPITVEPLSWGPQVFSVELASILLGIFSSLSRCVILIELQCNENSLYHWVVIINHAIIKCVIEEGNLSLIKQLNFATTLRIRHVEQISFLSTLAHSHYLRMICDTDPPQGNFVFPVVSAADCRQFSRE